MINAREEAVRILLEVEEGGKSHLALADSVEKNKEADERDLRFMRRLVSGSLERQMELDWHLDRLSKIPTAKMKPYMRCLLRMSAYQILYMDKIPASAAINEAVKLVRRSRFSGLSGFANGLLRALASEEEHPLPPEDVRREMPNWIFRRLKRAYGKETACQICEGLMAKRPLVLRCLVPEGEKPEEVRADILKSLISEGTEAEAAIFPDAAIEIKKTRSLTELSVFKEGRAAIQDPSSMLAGILAAPPKGAKLLDVCAAPGGKSIHLAELVGKSGSVDACDLTEQKAALIRENAERLKVRNLTVHVQDARSFRPEWENSFDQVTADLPCSGLGVIGRKPEIRFRISPDEIRELAELQREILKNVSRYVKPGGTLVYSTCTITEEENRENRKYILDELGFSAESFGDVLPEPLKGHTEVREGQLQLLPGLDPCDGFYIARFRKKI